MIRNGAWSESRELTEELVPSVSPFAVRSRAAAGAVRWVLLRLLRAVAVIMALVTVVFLLLRIAPGDPAVRVLGTDSNPEALAAVRERMGLDGTLWHQYFEYMRGLMSFDLGTSVLSRQSVNSIVSHSIPVTAWLIATAFGLSLLLAIPVGVALAKWQQSKVMRALRYALAASLGVPVFVSGLVLVLLFALVLKWLPAGGYERSFPANLEYLILPAVASAGVLVPVLSTVIASSVSETLRSEFVENALARRVSGAQFYVHYLLRPSAAPVIALAGYMIGQAFAAAVVTEIVFDLPGMGSALFSAIMARDYPIVQGIVLIVGVCVVVCSALADLLTAAIDPRYRGR